MKKIALLLITSIYLTPVNNALATTPISGNVELREIVSDEKSSQQLNFYGSSLTTENTLGISGVASVSKNYSEAYIGPIWSPAPWISLEASIGFQQVKNESPLRYAVAGWLGNDIGSIYYTREMGATSEDWWEKFMAFANISNATKLGAVYERGLGWGPIIEFPVLSTEFKIRATYYPEPNITQISLFFCF